MSLCGLNKWLDATFPELIQSVPVPSPETEESASSSATIPYKSFNYVFIDMQHVILNSCKSSSNNDLIDLFITKSDVIDYCLHFLETIFTLFRPTDVLYICMPGAEPYASITRSRNAAYLRADAVAELKSRTISDNDDGSDSSTNRSSIFEVNSTFAGTEFLLDLQKHLEYWVVNKINSDSDWLHFHVVVSAQDVPGETKHKISSFIREQKFKHNITNDTTLAIFSEEPEMILISSCLDVQNITLIFTDSQISEVHPERKHYKYLSISSFRDNLASHFKPCFENPICQATFLMKRLCWDFMFLCHIAGSRYFPQIPLLFTENCLEHVLGCYKLFIPYMKDYLITASRKLNFTELCEFFDKFSILEGNIFEKSIVPKMLKARNELIQMKGYSMLDAQLKARKEVYGFVYDHRPFANDGDIANEFSYYRMGFYRYKLKFKSDDEVCRAGMGLLKTLCWVIDATLSNIPSWDWSYPFPYSPMISDINQISNCKFSFKLDIPTYNLPFLMAVLPPQSQHLLPNQLQLYKTFSVVKEQKAHVDPMNFEDPKKYVVIIPPVDKELIQKTMQDALPNFTRQDSIRNMRGSRKVFKSSDREQTPFPSFLDRSKFPDINPCFVIVQLVSMENFLPKAAPISEHGQFAKDNPSKLQKTAPYVFPNNAKDVLSSAPLPPARILPPNPTALPGTSPPGSFPHRGPSHFEQPLRHYPLPHQSGPLPPPVPVPFDKNYSNLHSTF